MFTQEAYKKPSVMRDQLTNYITGLASRNNWPQVYTDGVLNLINSSYDEQVSIFKFNQTSINDFLIAFQNYFEEYTNNYTSGNPSQIPKYAKVYNVLSELIGTRDFIEESDSIANIVEEQAIEGAMDLQRKSDEGFRRLVPFVGIGLVAYFVLPRVITAIGDRNK